MLFEKYGRIDSVALACHCQCAWINLAPFFSVDFDFFFIVVTSEFCCSFATQSKIQLLALLEVNSFSLFCIYFMRALCFFVELMNAGCKI